MAKGSKEIRRRIRSVKSTQQITKAMKMVAAARLRKSEGRTQASRPYTSTLSEVMSNLAAVAGEVEHPFLKHIAPDAPRVMALLLTSDKGLCGAFNSNIVRKTEEFLREQRALGRSVGLICAGKRGLQYVQRAGHGVVAAYPSFTYKTTYAELKPVTELLTQAYLEREASEIYLIYSRFVNVMKNIPTVIRLLPIERFKGEPVVERGGFRKEYIMEPSPQELLKLLLPRYFQTMLFQAAIENYTSENGARMVAMENATRAAGEMIDHLTLQYNKARQSAITLELLDIVGGAEALKG